MSEIFKISPGSYLILDVSSAKGGVRYTRSKDPERPLNGGEGAEQEIHTHKTVDHKAMVKDGNNLVQSDVRCILRKHCAPTRIGWVCGKSDLPAIREAFAALDAKVAAFNRSAALAGSEIQVTVGYVPVELSINNAEAARFLAATVREVCADMIATLRAGDRKALANLARRAKHLDRLAIGMQRSSITFAVEAFKEARGALNTAAKESGLKGDKLAKHLAKVGAQLDLESIEACIDMFTELDFNEAAA